jgi:hypothetical protein
VPPTSPPPTQVPTTPVPPQKPAAPKVAANGFLVPVTTLLSPITFTAITPSITGGSVTYEFEVRGSGNQYSGSDTVAAGQAGSWTLRLRGLGLLTTYQFRARAVVDGVAGSYSNWADMTVLLTL